MLLLEQYMIQRLDMEQKPQLALTRLRDGALMIYIYVIPWNYTDI